LSISDSCREVARWALTFRDDSHPLPEFAASVIHCSYQQSGELGIESRPALREASASSRLAVWRNRENRDRHSREPPASFRYRAIVDRRRKEADVCSICQSDLFVLKTQKKSVTCSPIAPRKLRHRGFRGA